MNICTEDIKASVSHVSPFHNNAVHEYRNRNIVYEVHSHFPEEGPSAHEILFELGARKLKEASLPLVQEKIG